jgi:hypothetical protein
MAITFASGNYLQTFEGGTVVATSFKMKTTQTTSNPGVIGNANLSNSIGWMLLLNNATAGKPTFAAKDGGGTYRAVIEGTTTVNDGGWHDVAMNWGFASGSPCELFVDGVTNGSVNASAAWAPSSLVVRAGVMLNAFWPGYVGALAEVTLYKSNLTAVEIAALAKGFSPTKVCLSKIYGYIPLVREIADVKGAAITVSGTSASDHPRRFG